MKKKKKNTMEKLFELGGVQRFYVWNRTKKKYEPVRGLPVTLLVGGIEAFAYPNNRGDILYIMEAKTGYRMTLTNVNEPDKVEERIEYLQNQVNRLIKQTGVRRLEKTIQELISKQGISPRYNEDGTLKKGADKELKPAKKKTETFYVLLGNATFEPVEATKVKLACGYEGFARHRKGYGWEVSELQTGVKLVTAGTKAEAVAQAKEMIEKYPDKMKERVEVFIKRYGKSPYFRS
jgi:TolA-binding protein